MNDTNQTFAGMNVSVAILAIAGAVAAVFFFIVLYDYVSQRRKRPRVTPRRRLTAAVKSNTEPSLIKTNLPPIS